MSVVEFETEAVCFNGVQYHVSTKPYPYYVVEAGLSHRLLRFQEVQRLRRENFPFEEWNFLGEFWTSTKKSCSVMACFRLLEDGNIEPTGWDKTFSAWVVVIR